MLKTKPHSSRHPLWQRRWRQTVTVAAALALAATVGPVASQPPAEAADTSVTVTINGNDIQADNVNGLTFKGFGVLSANSTSAVLMDYKAQDPEAYSQLLKTLFGGSNPIMDHVKIEMGNDRNTSTGPNPATMRTLDEEANPARDPGFQLAADAKKINPDLKVSILRWREPYFASASNGTNATTYTWYKNTILAAYRQYGYMVDYLNPGRNETAVSWSHVANFVDWIRNDTTGYVSDDPALAGFKSPEEEALYKSIKIIVDDSSGLSSFGNDLKSNATYQSLIDVVGYHYTTNDDSAGNFKWWADTYDGEVWNSEAQATFSNSAFRPNSNTVDKDVSSTARQSPGIGGLNSALEMANTIVKGYVNSRRTHFIYQPAIGSFFEGGQYSYKELVSARDPWSGWTHYDAGLLMLEHFTDFAVTGWENDTNTAGIWRGVTSASVTTATGTNPIKGRDGGANHMTLAAPDKTAFSTIVVNDSEYAKTYTFNLANMNIAADASLEVWETRAADTAAGQAFNANYKKHVADVAPGADGSYTVSVKPWSIITVTSLDKSGDAEVLEPLPVEGERTVLDIEEDGDGVLWQDDFEYGDKTVPVFDSNGEPTAATESFIDSRGGPTGADALYTWDRQGAFEAYLEPGGDNYVLRQQVDQQALGGLGSAWNSGDPITGIGDYRWVNYKVSVDVRFDSDNTSNYAAVGARSTGGDNSQNLSATPYVLRLNRTGNWYLQRFGANVASGTMTAASDVWYNLALTVAGNKITAAIDGVEVAAYTDASPVLAGRVDLASGFYYTSFDNLLVEKLPTYAPYYSERLDSLETHDLASPPNAKLVYTGDWYHRNGEGMYNYQRSLSSSVGVGSTVAYTFTGTGFDIMANNSASATLGLTIDGHRVSTAEKNWPTSGYWRTSYSLRGLPLGQHTVKLEVLAGTLVIDSFDTIAGPVADSASVDLAPVTAALAATAGVIKTESFSEAEWAAFEAMRAQAAAAVADPAAYGLDAEGPAEIAARLSATALPGAWVLPTVSTATWQGQAPDHLPATLVATDAEEGITETFPITWDLDAADFDTAWSKVTVTGRYAHLETTATVEVVPEGLVYFADLNGVASGLGEGTSALGYTSPAYLSIAGLAEAAGQPLLNDKADQVYSATSGWGHQAYQSNGTTSSIAYKGIIAGAYDKVTTTGIYSGQNAVGALTTYTFKLPAGNYALAFNSYSWWASSSRTTQVYIDYGSTRSTTALDTFTLSTSANTSGYLGTFPVELAEEGEVTLRLRATNAQAPMLSWAAVYEVPTDKSALIALAALVDDLDEGDYTADSWAGLAAPAVAAEDVIADPEATQADVNGALAALQSAVDALELKVVGLEVVTAPTRTVYTVSADGGELDLAGLEVRFVYADQTTSAALAADAYEVSGFSLAELGAQEVTVSAAAQGQVFEAAFEILVNPRELSLGVVVSIRCVSGRAYLGVQVTNTDSVPADLVLTSSFGSKAFSAVAATKKATHNFTTALPTIGDGSVGIRGVGSGGGPAAPVVDRSVSYAPASCVS